MPNHSTRDFSARHDCGARHGLARLCQDEEDGADRAFIPW